MELPKAAVAIIKTGGSFTITDSHTYLKLNCSLDYTVRVGDGYARKISDVRDTEGQQIQFPANPISDSDFNFIIKEVKAHFEIFNIDIVTSFSALWASNAQKKTVVFLCDTSAFQSSLEYNSLVTSARWRVDDPKDGLGNGEIGDRGTLGMYLCIIGDELDTMPDIAIVFTNKIQWGERIFIPHPDNSTGNPLPQIGYQLMQSITEYPAKQIADTVTHELGHAFKLYHWGLNVDGGNRVLDYYSGNMIWAPVMGNGADILIKQWSDGSYDNSYNINGQQDDISMISSQAGLLKLKDVSKKNKKKEDGSTPSYLENSNQLISRRAKLASVLDVKEIQGVKAIEGMIGFPDDTDVLKIILKAGNYEIGGFKHDDPNFSMLNLGLKILKSKIEVSKQSSESNRKRIPEEEKEETRACSAEFLPEKYPSSSKEECVALNLPEAVYISRPDLSEADPSILVRSLPVIFEDERVLSFSVGKTCLIYLRTYGEKVEIPNTTGFPRYGSVGKYRVIIRKNGEDYDLNNILPQQTPPNSFATDKLKCVLNGALEDKIFFTQDPSDFSKNPPYDNVSDYPNAKKYNIVINGKIIKIPFLLQGKEYGLNDAIDERDKKQLFAVSSQVVPNVGKPRIQEFTMAPAWDY
jgi:hypothetical protein